MSQKKKQIRENFRNVCLKRDNNKCKMCSKSGVYLDVHHITDRNHFPNGGYVLANGISLCESCHVLAEQYHSTGISHPGYSPEDLYRKIGSTYKRATLEDAKNA